MIAISATTYDIAGHVVIDASPENPYDTQRRGSVTATLDGSVSVYDAGYSTADQTIRCRVKSPSRALLQQLRYLVAHYPQLVLCCDSGAFLCVPSLSTSSGEAALSFRIIKGLN